jgi:predicted nucleotide-binding protein (sugar kinase/HSP70/actin superfamily)
MYNKFQRLVLDRFEDLRGMPIASITTADSYSAAGLVPARDATRFRLMAYMTMIVADVFDRILWRTRPYERRAGAAAELHAETVARFSRDVENGGLRTGARDFQRAVAEFARAARELIDPELPRRPRIGIVGEIYLRSHPFSNQGLVEELELHGAEVVNATLAEWVCFISWCHVRDQRRGTGVHLRRGRVGQAGRAARRWLGHAIEYRYLNARRRGVYAAALRHLDFPADHDVHGVERRVREGRLFSFDIGTESVLSIGGALENVAHGCDGIVNVYPFTCMPGTIASSVLNPVLAGMGVPYLEVPCDGTRRGSRETQIRTFVWQAAQRRSIGKGAAAPR